MGTSAFAPEIEQHGARQPAWGPVALSITILNMGLEEIQKQAKAS